MDNQKDSPIYGIRPVMEALESGIKISRVIVKQGLSGSLVSQLMVLLKQRNVPVQYVPVEAFDRFKDKNHQGVVAFSSPIEFQSFENLLPMLLGGEKKPFILILDRVTDVRNFGAIARTAECAGVDAIVIPAKGAASLGSDALKTSAGALNHIPVCRVGSLKITINLLKQHGFSVIAATEKAQKSYFEVNLTGAVAIVVGSEDSGISPDIIKLADELVRIPIFGKIESLNVSVATGVVLYEVVRQRLL